MNDPDCRQQYDTAIQQFQGGRYEAALEKFQAAYAQRQMPWLLVNIGRTLHRLGRLKEAVVHYERYQQAAPTGDPETKLKVQEYLAQARVLLQQSPNAPLPDAATGSLPPGSAPALSTTSPESVPRYKKWWFWTAIGGGVVVATILGVGIGVGVGNSASPAMPMPMPMPSILPTGVVVYRPIF